MHRLSPTFALLERRLQRHVRDYATELGLDLEGRALAMTDWSTLKSSAAPVPAISSSLISCPEP